jgi:hypothetical protein
MKSAEFWEEDSILKDLLFQTNMSLSDVAEELDLTRYELNKRLKEHGLEWVKRKNRKLSRGHAALLGIMQSLLPGEEIVVEHHVGERLMLDIYCPSYKLAAEYHGRQHFFYSNLFHQSPEDFKRSQQRDERKIELCKEQGIALIAFRFCDKLTEEAVFERMLEAIKETAPVEPEKKNTFKGNHYYEKMKHRNREYRKAQYRELKKRKNGK